MLILGLCWIVIRNPISGAAAHMWVSKPIIKSAFRSANGGAGSMDQNILSMCDTNTHIELKLWPEEILANTGKRPSD